MGVVVVDDLAVGHIVGVCDSVASVWHGDGYDEVIVFRCGDFRCGFRLVDFVG